MLIGKRACVLNALTKSLSQDQTLEETDFLDSAIDLSDSISSDSYSDNK